MQSRHITLLIRAHWQDVYAFAANPQNLPLWAAGLRVNKPIAEGDAEHWYVDSPQGRVKLHFCPHNTVGVLDHWVTLPNGSEVYVPMRVIACGDFAEVI